MSHGKGCTILGNITSVRLLLCLDGNVFGQVTGMSENMPRSRDIRTSNVFHRHGFVRGLLHLSEHLFQQPPKRKRTLPFSSRCRFGGRASSAGTGGCGMSAEPEAFDWVLKGGGGKVGCAFAAGAGRESRG
jgi:hypothetical protein